MFSYEPDIYPDIYPDIPDKTDISPFPTRTWKGDKTPPLKGGVLPHCPEGQTNLGHHSQWLRQR